MFVINKDDEAIFLTQNNAVAMPVAPSAPLNFMKDELTSFMGTADTMTLSITWSAPEYEGGLSVIEYRIETKVEDLLE